MFELVLASILGALVVVRARDGFFDALIENIVLRRQLSVLRRQKDAPSSDPSVDDDDAPHSDGHPTDKPT